MSGRNGITVLVTGVGDTVGQALIKAARQASMPCRLVGTDRDPLAVGLQWVDVRAVLPHSSRTEEYLAAMTGLCAAESVALVLPGSEKELELLAHHAAALRADTGAIVVGSPPDVLRVTLDKWETCRFLERAGLNVPRFARIDDAEDVAALVDQIGFPLIAKPVRGTGARGLTRVSSKAELEALRGLGSDAVLQEYLEPEDQEYSVGAYVLHDGRPAGTISYRREQLVAGDTYRARVGSHPAVEAEAQAVVEALGPSGPCNVQLRHTRRGPVTFEINARFSGGAAMRAHFGYNEVEMAIRDLVLHEPVPVPTVASGMALRYWEEMYVPDEHQGLAHEPSGLTSLVMPRTTARPKFHRG